MKITRKLLRSWNACYSDTKLAKLVPTKGLTPRQVAAMHIPIKDRLWMLLREEILPSETLRLLACHWAREALATLPPEQINPRTLAVIKTAERYALGEATEEELVTARAAAWDATWDYAPVTVFGAAWYAAGGRAFIAFDDPGARALTTFLAARDVAWSVLMARTSTLDNTAWEAMLTDVIAELPEEAA